MLLLRFMLLLIGFGALACTAGLVIYDIFLALELDRILRRPGPVAEADTEATAETTPTTAPSVGTTAPSFTTRTSPSATRGPATMRPATSIAHTQQIHRAVLWHAAAKLIAIGAVSIFL